jgi:hypothetical protein
MQVFVFWYLFGSDAVGFVARVHSELRHDVLHGRLQIDKLLQIQHELALVDIASALPLLLKIRTINLFSNCQKPKTTHNNTNKSSRTLTM